MCVPKKMYIFSAIGRWLQEFPASSSSSFTGPVPYFIGSKPSAPWRGHGEATAFRWPWGLGYARKHWVMLIYGL